MIKGLSLICMVFTSFLFANDNTFFSKLESFSIIGVLVVLFIFLLFILTNQYIFPKYARKLKVTQSRLENSILEFEHVFDTTMEVIAIFEAGKCIKINEEAVKLFKFNNKEECIGLTPFDFICETSHEIIKHHLKIATTQPYEVIGKKQDDTLFPALIKGHTYTINNKVLRITTLIDLTELRMKDKILAEQSKMASMGEMMANIAHQWRQPLSVISTATSGMQLKKEMDILSDDDFNEYSNAILKNANYLSHTIDDFKNFLQKDKRVNEFDLEKTIEKVCAIINSSLTNKDIILIKNIEPNCILKNIENELIQALINIINNAKDAICEKLESNEKRIVFIDVKKENNKIKIIIKDNAQGIKEEILDRIFEPYFTTKHKSQGTGLGLYMTHQIITKSMKGTIQAKNVNYSYESEEYKGACFIIEFTL